VDQKRHLSCLLKFGVAILPSSVYAITRFQRFIYGVPPANPKFRTLSASQSWISL
jgi:hypothetical protein